MSDDDDDTAQAEGEGGTDADAQEEDTEQRAPVGDFFFQGKPADADAVVSKVPTGRMDPFLYRHIRNVSLRLKNGFYELHCSCLGCVAACSPCTHMFLVLDFVAPTLRLSKLNWHPRTKKKYYFNALFEQESGIPLQDLINTVREATPKIPLLFVEQFLARNKDAPSDEGVPQGGRLTADYEAMEMQGGDVAEHDDTAGAHNAAKPVRRPAAPDKAASDQLQWQITECLGKQHPIYKEWVKIQMSFRDDLMRRGVEQAGPGVRNRIRAFYEPGKTGKKTSGGIAARHEHSPPSEVTGMLEEVAREYLLEFGAVVNTILEVHPDVKARRAGQRWFMIVKKANVVEVEGKSSIESCRWCKTNTLQPCPVFKDLIHCNIQEVKAYGVRDAPFFKDVISELRVIADPPVPDPAPTPAPWLTEKVAVKFLQGANKDAVISVTLQEMKEQMLQRGVKGIEECNCKEDLTALMRAEKFVFDSKLFKSVPAISDIHLNSAAPGTAPGSRSIVWREVLVGWKNTQGRVVANSENWVLQRKAKEVLSLTYADLRCAMKEANVPGVDQASNVMR